LGIPSLVSSGDPPESKKGFADYADHSGKTMMPPCLAATDQRMQTRLLCVPMPSPHCSAQIADLESAKQSQRRLLDVTAAAQAVDDEVSGISLSA